MSPAMPGPEPGLLDPETSALTTSPLRLYFNESFAKNNEKTERTRLNIFKLDFNVVVSVRAWLLVKKAKGMSWKKAFKYRKRGIS